MTTPTTVALILSALLLGSQPEPTKQPEPAKQPEKQPEKTPAPATQPGPNDKVWTEPPAPEPALKEVWDFEANPIAVVADGFVFTEGPVWAPAKGTEKGTLLFCDVRVKRSGGSGEIKKLVPGGADGKMQGEALYSDADRPCGLAWDKDGNLVVASWAGEILKYGADGKKTLLTDNVDGKHLNSPNDLCVRADGSIYFTDPSFGRGQRPNETGMNGVYRLAADGTVTAVIPDFSAPNGIAFSPDQSKLYVTEYGKGEIWEFSVSADGAVGARKLFADVKNNKNSANPDGLKVDQQGNIYAACRPGVWVYKPDGTLLGKIRYGSKESTTVTNIAFGGDDGKTLYMTTGNAVYSVKLKNKGCGMK